MAFGGLDVGTSGCKFVLFNDDGEIICSAKRKYNELGNDGRRELDPKVVWMKVKETIREIAEKSTEPIEGFAIATMGESVVALDSNSHCINNAMVTGDVRGKHEIPRLIKRIGREKITEITGLPPSEMYALPKLLWLNENTDVIKRAESLFLFEDFIGYRLTGEKVVSYSSASRTMAFDVKEYKWSEELLECVGISVNKMSEPKPSGTIIGTVTQDVADELGLDRRTKVVVGGHDQVCATLGAGVSSKDFAEDGLGTCEVMSVMLEKFNADNYMIENDLACVPYVFKNTYLTYLVLTTCGVLMNWFRDIFYDQMHKACEKEDKNVFEELDKMAGNEPTNLLVLPQFGSSGIPDVDYEAYGLFWGMTTETTKVEMYRALKESMAYQMLLAYETLEPLGVDAKDIRITGGGASDFNAQLRADVFNKEVKVLKQNEAGACGCAILTGVAIGKYSTIEDAISKLVKFEKTFYPNIERHEKYEAMYKKYKKLYRLMRDFK